MKGYTAHKTKFSKSRCDMRSVRNIKRGPIRLLICCPKGKWSAKRERCKVGTRAFEVLKRRRRR